MSGLPTKVEQRGDRPSSRGTSLTRMQKSDQGTRPQEPSSSTPSLSLSGQTIREVERENNDVVKKTQTLNTATIVIFKLLGVTIVTCLVIFIIRKCSPEGGVHALKDHLALLKAYRYGAPLVYYLADSLLVSVGMSGETMNILGGYLFGHLMGKDVYGSQRMGTIVAGSVCQAGTMSGGLITFWLGRSWFKHHATAMKQKTWWRALDNIICRHGLILVTSLRLSPIVPFALLNLLLGASHLSTYNFIISVFGSLPLCVFCVSFGSNGRDGLHHIWSNYVYKRILLSGLVITIIVTSIIIHILKNEIKRIEHSTQTVMSPTPSQLTSPLLEVQSDTRREEDSPFLSGISSPDTMV